MRGEMVSAHFSAEEMACHHCKRQGVKPELLEALENFRKFLGKPIIVHSAYRCAQHQVERAKIAPGYHTKGIAADIVVPGMSAREMYAAAVKSRLWRGFGVSDEGNYIHVDLRQTPARWCYGKSGQVVAWFEPKVKA